MATVAILGMGMNAADYLNEVEIKAQRWHGL
jgi:hypothetical protein